VYVFDASGRAEIEGLFRAGRMGDAATLSTCSGAADPALRYPLIQQAQLGDPFTFRLAFA
jgi:hypothetical protein